MNTRKLLAFVPVTVLVGLLMVAACKDKKIVGPDDPPADSYRLTMSANDTFYYFVDNENLVTIRVFLGNTIPVGVEIRYRTESDIGFIDASQTIIAQQDTILRPYGTNIPMDYHCDDTLVFKDTIYGYAVVAAETVATANVSFFLRHQP